jgi:hypothetical protein
MLLQRHVYASVYGTAFVVYLQQYNVAESVEVGLANL